jgi:antitoxin component of RelBE/YafQ-DinJ toxin-antitoxin module
MNRRLPEKVTIDPKILRSAAPLLKKNGFSLSEFVSMCLVDIIKRKEIPLENYQGSIYESLAEKSAASHREINNGTAKAYTDVHRMFADLKEEFRQEGVL